MSTIVTRGPVRVSFTIAVRASNAAYPGKPMLAMAISPNVTVNSGERRTQPRRSATRPVQNPARIPATQAANALRAMTNARIKVRVGAHASGPNAASASTMTPASPTIE